MAAKMMFSLEHHSRGPRVRLFGQRIHHGAVGMLVALALMVHDRRDWRSWFTGGWQ